MLKAFLLSITCFLLQSQTSFSQGGFSLTDHANGVDIRFNGQLLTSYLTIDSIYKPILYPVNTVDGITVTRGFPLQPRAGEPTDHPHHTGLWLNYESVNGLDFWNNSNAIAAERKHLYGHIVHDKIVSRETGPAHAMLTVSAHWLDNNKMPLLSEATKYEFKVVGNMFYITRTTTLTALAKEVVFKDVKDGFFAIRLARELQLPEMTTKIYKDANGIETRVEAKKDSVANGMYVASNGKTGNDVWSSQGNWVKLQGKIAAKNITVAMFDHPANPGYPTYWHARGYGLFALNPLGRKVFSNGKEELNLRLQPGQSKTFRYQLMVASGKEILPAELDKMALEFSKQ